jgi:hypothetical protein
VPLAVRRNTQFWFARTTLREVDAVRMSFAVAFDGLEDRGGEVTNVVRLPSGQSSLVA